MAEHFFAPERLSGDSFVVRAYRPGDGPALAAGKRGSYAHLSPWLPWASETETDEDNEALARRFCADYLTGSDFVMGIWDAEEAHVLGGTGFHGRGVDAVADKTAEIGMWISASAAGSGLGTSVLRALLRWGFTEWPWERLSWHCDAANHASRRVAEKAGMRLEGTLRGEKSETSDERRTTLIFGAIRSDLPSLPDAPAWSGT